MQTIQIKENTSCDVINLEWQTHSKDEIKFRISNKSSFQLFAEGFALGVLRDLVLNKSIIIIELFKSPELDISGFPVKIYPIFKSIFGLELLRICDSIVDRNNTTLELRNPLGTFVWKSALNSGGVLQDGKKIYLISRHGYKVPKCLRGEDLSDNSFPRYDYFQTNIARFLPNIRGQKKQIGQAEKLLFEWLHQMAENVYEHGCMFEGKEDNIEGYYGIILEKFVFLNDLDKRKDLPGFMKTYIKKQMKLKKNSTILNAATVIDLGQGIQHTLPATASVISGLDALNFAFEDGVTRKKTNRDEKSGYGLSQSVNAAVNLGAFFFVISGNIQATLDLSDKTNIPANNRGKINFLLKEQLTKISGTSISITWLD